MSDKKLVPVLKTTRYRIANDVLLTQSQTNALEDVFNWRDSHDTDYWVIAGSAGTGKTFITTIIANFINKHAVFCAPTHQATAIVAQNVKGHTTHTLHKLLGIRPNMGLEEYDSNNPKFSQQGKIVLLDYDMVVVDEASMINKSLFKMLRTLCQENGIMLLFIGDELQLPPVKENSSRVFDDLSRVSVLTDIVRQAKDNPLVELLDLLRYDIPRKGNSFISFLYKNTGKRNDSGDGYYFYRNNAPTSKAGYQAALRGAATVIKATNNPTFSRFLAYTNDSVFEWNKFLRKRIMGDGNILEAGDVLTGYATIVDAFFTPILINSASYSVTMVNPYVNPHGLSGFLMQARNTTDGKLTPLMFVLDHSNKNTLDTFIMLHEDLRNAAITAPRYQKAKAWEAYYEFKDRILILATIKDSNGILVVKKDIDYGYATTIHKSQGSTYDNVFVNVLSILYDSKGRVMKDINLRNRLLYVALSRASKRAMILS